MRRGCVGVAEGRARQGGVALIITLVFLVMLTALGVTMLSSTRMGQDMAANFQETSRAFQTAETGIVANLNHGEWEASTNTITGSGTVDIGHYDFERVFNDFYPLKRRKSKIFSAIHFQRAQFSVESNAEVKSGDALVAKATVGEGVYLIVPKL